MTGREVPFAYVPLLHFGRFVPTHAEERHLRRIMTNMQGKVPILDDCDAILRNVKKNELRRARKKGTWF